MTAPGYDVGMVAIILALIVAPLASSRLRRMRNPLLASALCYLIGAGAYLWKGRV